MAIGYLHWQLWVGPAWLLRFIWTLQLALWKFYSVPVMIITLVAPWHQDRVSLRQGSISGILKAIGWNLISRFIGFLVRLSVLIAFLVSEYVFVVGAAATFAFFLAWPVVAVLGIILGAGQLLSL